MMLRLLFIEVSFFFLIGCAGSFTPSELKIIRDGEDVMRVLKIDNQEDSVFLCQPAGGLSLKDVSTDIFQELKRRMLLTVNDSTDPGVGIAAPQIGIGKQLIAVQRYDKKGAPFEFYINPLIEYASPEESLGAEGCLSIPDISGKVWRSNEIIISYNLDPIIIKRKLTKDKSDSTFKLSVGIEYEAQWIRKRDTVRGFTAVIFQHEIDHLQGILFTDRAVKEEQVN